MKKKFVVVLAFMFLTIMCFGLTSCKGKYDDMKFQLLYAYSEDSDTWMDGSKGIHVFYGTDEDEILLDENQQGHLFLKVVVKNVKAKNIGDLFVTDTVGASSFASKTLKQNDIFTIDFSSNISLNLKVSETKSKNSAEFSIDISRALEDIQVDTTIKPATMVGWQINLARLNILTFLPYNELTHETLTTQTAVSYEVDSVGYFENNVYREPQNVQNAVNSLTFDGAILQVSNTFPRTRTCNVAKIAVTSLYKNLSAEFYVYILNDTQNLPVNIAYLNGTDVEGGLVELYQSSQYDTTTIKVDAADLLNETISTSDGELSYKINVYYNGQRLDLEGNQPLLDKKFRLTKNGNEFTILALPTNTESSVNLEFKLEMSGLNFSASNIKGENTRSLQITSKWLPSYFMIDSTQRLDKNEQIERTIFNNKNSNNGVDLTIQAMPNIENQKIFLTDFVGLSIGNTERENGQTFVYSGTRINVKLDELNLTVNPSLTLRVLAVPEKFNGQAVQVDDTQKYITATIVFKKIVTADSFEIFENASTTNAVKLFANADDALNNNFLDSETNPNSVKLGVGVGATNSIEKNDFFLKVYHQNYTAGAIFDPSSITLYLPQNTFAFEGGSLNDDGQNTISLDRLVAVDEKTTYTTYRITFDAVERPIITTASIVVGDGSVDAGNNVFKLEAVNLSNGSFDVTIANANPNAIKIETENHHKNFAVAYGSTVEFNVVGQTRNGATRTKEVVYGVKQNAETSLENVEHFSSNAVDLTVNGSIIIVKAKAEEKTAIYSLDITYYTYDNTKAGLIRETAKLIIEFAVYVPINMIRLEPQTTSLIHFDENILANISGLADFAKTSFSYTGYNTNAFSADGTLLAPSSCVSFADEGLSGMVEYSSPNANALKIVFESNRAITISSNNKNLSNGDQLESFSGEIQIELTDDPNMDYVNVTIAAYTFDIQTNATSSLRFDFDDYDRATGIEIGENDSIVKRGEDSYYIYLSFLTKEKETAEFDVSLKYENAVSSNRQLNYLYYEIYKIEQDEFGNPVMENGAAKTEKLTTVPFVVTISKGKVSLDARIGGLYKLVLISADNTEISQSLYVQISDGTQKNKYVISNGADFKGINENANKYFVLNNDISVSSDQVVLTEFNGYLSGLNQTLNSQGEVVSSRIYTIDAKISNSSSDGTYNFVGLFQKLGEDAVVEDLNLVASFDLSEITAATNLFIGGLAGENKGVIKNVNLSIKSVKSVLGSQVHSDSIYFGGLVGSNKNQIELDNASISAEDFTLDFQKNATFYIGAIAGENICSDGYNGVIEGRYLGKESLTEVSYSVVANFAVADNDATYYVGGAVGYNNSLIQNLIIGGRIALDKSGDNNSNASYLGGIVGWSKKENYSEQYSIKTCAVLGLDLTNNFNNGGVAGIVGNSQDDEIFDVRVISTIVKFNNFETSGRIIGANYVASIASRTASSNIQFAAVESFITTIIENEISSPFCALYSENGYVAGLVYDADSSSYILNSFANINIKLGQTNNPVYLTSNAANETATYFIGKIISNGVEVNTFGNIIGNSAKESYAIVYDNENIYYNTVGGFTTLDEQIKSATYEDVFEEVEPDGDNVSAYYISEDNVIFNKAESYVDGKKYYQLKDNIELFTEQGDKYELSNQINLDGLFVFSYENWETFVANNLINVEDTENSGSWKLEKNKNTIAVGNINYYLPYLLKDGASLMISRPTQIQANINQEYVIEINSIYVADFNYDVNSDNQYDVVETVIVNYHEPRTLTDSNIDKNRYNTYNLFKDESGNGLISLTIVNAEGDDPVEGGVKAEVVSGNAYITNDGKQIVFTSSTNQGGQNHPVIIRCYSLFNADIESYVAVFAEPGLTDLTLESPELYKLNNSRAKYVLNTYTGASTTYIQLGAQNLFEDQAFNTILSGAMINNLKLEAVEDGEDDILQITTGSTVKDISLKISNQNFNGTYIEKIITFSLSLNLTKYFGETYFQQVDGQDQYKFLTDVKLLVRIFKATQNLTVSNDSATIDSSTRYTFETYLKTYYMSGDEKFGNINTRVDGNYVYLDEQDKDSIYLEFSADEQADQTELNNLVGNGSIANLFEYQFSYSLHYDGENVDGYTYKISLNLKNEFKHINKNLKLKIKVYSATNSSYSKTINLTITPTNVETGVVNNYLVNHAEMGGDLSQIIETNLTETSLISPDSLGSVMIIHLYPNFASVKQAIIRSDTLFVPSIGKEVSLIFEQLVYNSNIGKYQTLNPIVSDEDIGENALELQFISNTANEFTGVLYVHAMVSDNFKGFSGALTAQLNITNNDGSEVLITKPLTTEYIPSVSLTHDGPLAPNAGRNEYLIQRDTYDNLVSLTLYGYEFANNPVTTLEWNLTNENGYSYGSDRSIIKDGDNEILVTDYVSVQTPLSYENLTPNPDGSYTLTYKVRVKPNTPASFKVRVSLTITNEEGYQSSESDEIVFHPVDYIITAVSVKNLNNGILYLNYAEQKALNLQFETRTKNDLSDAIYNKLINDLKGTASDVNLDTLAELISFSYGGQRITLKDVKYDQIQEFIVNYDDSHHVTLTGRSEMDSTAFTIDLPYYYKESETGTGEYELCFGTGRGNSSLLSSFNLIVYSGTTEETAVPVYTAEQFVELTSVAGLDLILMNDITLGATTPYTPIETPIASLDGNNKVIKIKRFAIDTNTSGYGLFASVGTYRDVEEDRTKQTILKNVVVDYSEFEGGGADVSGNSESSLILTNNNITNVVFGGLVGTVNEGGLIYNCDVVNLSNTNKLINILVDSLPDVTVNFGGLVGINNGIITNSRVGSSKFKRVDATGTATAITSGSLSFIVGNANPSANATDEQLKNANGFVGVAAGFAAVNGGTITSSYVANTNLVNYSTRNSQTAGFVGTNSGVVAYSYVKGSDKDATLPTISSKDDLDEAIQNYSDMARSTESTIAHRTNGNVAGFVYDNSAQISNCYANIKLETKSAYIAGFVYRNGQAEGDGSIIDMCYSACDLNAGTTQDAAEQPFVGATSSDEVLSYGELNSCYYLKGNYVLVSDKDNINKPQATELAFNQFTDSKNLANFVFVDNDPMQGVWYYPDHDASYLSQLGQDGEYKHLFLPELTGANQIAISCREIQDMGEDDADYAYVNKPGYETGSQNNPYIIRDVEEYNRVMTNSGATEPDENGYKSQQGYFRLINNIDFVNDATTIKTRTKFILGDETETNVTSLEGNGLTISGIYLDVTSVTDADEVGLFARIENAYIKNLNLTFRDISYQDGQFSTVQVKFSGGLAGKANNSALININLNGANSAIAGKNIAGGLAGIVTGESTIQNITSNLSVMADYIDNNGYVYYNETDFGNLTFDGDYQTYLSQLSYAGGIVGIADIEAEEREEGAQAALNISNINVLGNEMQRRANGNIFAMYAGGVIGYASKDVNALRLKYFTGANDTIYGQTAAGGIFGIGQGAMTACQVSASEDTQYNYDTVLGEYVINLDSLTSTPSIDKANAGNLKLLSGYKFVGGLVGVSVNQSIADSYSKVGLKNAEIFGGVAGLSIGSSLSYVYSIPYVNLDDFDLYTNTDGNMSSLKVGGLLGAARKVPEENSEQPQDYESYINFAKIMGVTPTQYTNIVSTFSTVILDVNEVNSILNSENENLQTWFGKNVKFDYICPDGGSFIRSNGLELDVGSVNIFYGQINNYPTIGDGESLVGAAGGQGKNLHQIYNLDDGSQEDTFLQIFSHWPVEYWTKNNIKYFPLLVKEDEPDYIEIENASDFENKFTNPNGRYKIVNDIDMSGYSSSGNWIFEMNFQGVLVGERKNSNGVAEATIPRVYNLKLNPNANDSTGLFRQTTGAQISNIDFVWYYNYENTSEGAISLGNDVTNVGGVSCLDENSQFTNIGVYCANYDAETRKIDETSQTNETKGGLITSNDHTISGFGGIVADGTNSTIINCKFSGNVTATLSGAGQISAGGLVGQGKMKENEEGDLSAFQNNITITGSSVGDNTYKAVFNYTITGASNATTYNIGGAIGYIDGGATSQNSVGGFQTDNSQNRIELSVAYSKNNDQTGNITLNYGGLVGLAHDTVISNNEVLAKMVCGEMTSSLTAANVAGLVGQYNQNATKSSSVIRINSTDVDINLNKIKASNSFVAGGVGHILGGGDVKIERCLFTGDISSLADSTGTDSQGSETGGKNVFAGGFVGSLGTMDGGESNLSVTLLESLSASNLTIGSQKTTESIFMGGLVGFANGKVVASNCLTSGKIVPITTASSGTSAEAGIVVGGLVGTANKVDVSNTISTSSIVADSISPKAIRKIEINALIGRKSDEDGALTLNNVYYSSDVALFPDQASANAGAVNLSAEILYGNSYDWQANLVSTSAWSKFGSGLPVLTNLDAQYKFNITAVGEYAKGSSLNPIVLSQNSDLVDNTAYTYYLLDKDADLNSMSIGELYGVLIGAEKEYEVTSSTGSIVSIITSNSAVSNLHLVLKGNVQIENYGFIASTNNGVVYNCSVQGTGISLQSEGRIGLIAGINSGLVSFSYSSAEIIAIGSFGVSGIVDTNNGAILSSYFTGYINNSNNQISAGIVNNLDSNSYIYNCYSAGVITNIASNIFASGAFTESCDGSNNYIDVNANKQAVRQEYISPDNELENHTYIETIDTGDLMYATEKLKGNWFTSVSKNGDGYYVNFGSDTYGFNYFYPIYNFNKLVLVDGSLKQNPTMYQLYTGTGADEATTDIVNYGGDVSVRFNNIKTNENDIYTNAIKIPHLGVLKAVQGIITTPQQGEVKTTNLNYVLIYDIDGARRASGGTSTNSYYDWKALGTSDSNKTEFIANPESTKFEGVFVSNRYYNYTATTSNYVCTVKNLSGEGLFDNLSNAYIADIKFGNMYDMKDSGPLAVSTSKNLESLTINNISYEKGATISGIPENSLSALIGKIQFGEITIINSGVDDGEKVSLLNAKYAGFLAGQMSGGNVMLRGTKFAVSFGAASGMDMNAGGLIGQIYAGTVSDEGSTGADGLHSTISIKPSKVDNAYINLGGIVAISSASSETSGAIQFSNVSVDFDNEAIEAQNFGGLIYSVNKNANFTTCSLSVSGGNSLNIALMVGDIHYFGLLAAQSSANLAVDGLDLTRGSSTALNVNVQTSTASAATQNDNFDSKNNGFGVLTGYMAGGTIALNTQSINVNFTTNGYNIGGMVGYFASGSFNLNELLSENYKVDIQGYYNVGGAIGYLSDVSLNALIETDSWNFLASESSFATISLHDSENLTLRKNYYNWGGLFGYAKNLSGDDSAEEKTTIINRNEIKLTALSLNKDQTTANPQLKNVGGVAGKFEGGGNNIIFANYGTISFDSNSVGDGKFYGADNNEAPNGFELSIGSFYNGSYYYAVQSINVGGVFGYVQSTPETPLLISNDASVMGYQNVGGLIGYAKSAVIGAEDTTIKSAEQIIGVVNVGGAVGLSEGSTFNYVTSESNVYGNYNVGGLAGFVNDTIITNSLVGPTDGETKTTIKGINFYPITNNNNENLSQAFIPTNVGGLFGGLNSNAQYTLTHNTINNVSISSTNEGTGCGTDFTPGYIISTISNPVLYMDSQLAYDTALNINDLLVLENNKLTVKDANMAPFIGPNLGGFGGFAGSITSSAVMTTDFNTNKISGVTIQASSGINVGGLYGHYITTTGITGEDNVTRYIQTPTISGNMEVSGAYFVGGIAGYLDSRTTVGFLTQSDGKYVSLDGAVTIELQTDANIAAMYVGGLFGRLAGTANEMKIFGDGLKVVIHNSSSYYVGGLIGRLEGNLGLESSPLNTNIVDGEQVDISGGSATFNKPLTVVGDAKETFGGLVGMLKVEESNNGVTANVIGWQPFAFTVNTIENSNYYDGETTTQAYATTSEVNLVAQAYYANKDTFNISYSRGGAAVGNDFTSTTDRLSSSNWFKANSTNPLNSLAHGWAKEYTMFKTVQRNIPMSKNNGAGWDAISPIYDASNITAVGVLEDIYPTNVTYNDGNEPQIVTSVNKDKEDQTQSVKDFKTDHGADYICYTVYDENGDNPKLYSRIGIASAFTNVYQQNDNGDYDYSTKYVKPKDEDGTSLWDSTLDNLGGGGRRKKFLCIDLNKNNMQALYYLNWLKGDTDGVEGFERLDSKKGTTGIKPTDHEGSDIDYPVLIYYVNDYLYNEHGNSSNYGYVTEEVKGQNKYGLYFMFGILYDNASLDKTNGREIFGGQNFDETLPADGSMFNVKGMITDNAKTYWETPKGDSSGQVLSVLVYVLGITLMVVSYIASNVVFPGVGIAGIWLTVGNVLAAIQGTIGLVIVGMQAWSDLQNMLSYGNQLATEVMFDRKDQSMGYMHGTYTRPIEYDINGQLIADVDESITWADMPYYPSTSIRPNDYYTNYYYFLPIENAPNSGDDQNPATELGIPLSKEQGDACIEQSNNPTQQTGENGKGYYWQNVSYNGATGYLYLKYAYQNGTYYSLFLTNEIEYSRKTGQLDTSNKQEFNDYITAPNGQAYVRGAYDGNEYSSAQIFSNKFYVNDKNEKSVNDVPWSDIVSNYGLGENDWYYNHTSQFVYVTNITEKDGTGTAKLGGFDDTLLYYGYGYMKNAYYTANGTQNDQLRKVGQFDYYGTTYPKDGTPGIDYIEGTYVYGVENHDKPIYEDPDDPESGIKGYEKDRVEIPIYFKFAEAYDTHAIEGSTTIGDENNTDSEPSTNVPSVYVYLYPKSFTNPYNEELYQGKNDTWWKNLQDDKYYINKDYAEVNGVEVEHQITYYFYEGGYKSETVTIGDDKQEMYYSQFLKFGHDGEPYANDLPTLQIFDDNGNEIKFALSTDPTVKEGGYQLRMDVAIDNAKYKDANGNEQVREWYTVSRKALGLDGEENKDTWDSIKFSYLVYNCYKVEFDNDQETAGTIYQQSNNYIIKDGLLSSYRSKSSSFNYNVGKYLINKDHSIYVRYFYVNDKKDGFETGLFKLSTNSQTYMFLFKRDSDNQININGVNTATKLTESVCVSLGGGTTYNATNGFISAQTIGSINPK